MVEFHFNIWVYTSNEISIINLNFSAGARKDPKQKPKKTRRVEVYTHLILKNKKLFTHQF